MFLVWFVRFDLIWIPVFQRAASERVINKSQGEVLIFGGGFCCGEGSGWKFWLRHAARVALTDRLHWTGLNPDTSYTHIEKKKTSETSLAVQCRDFLLEIVNCPTQIFQTPVDSQLTFSGFLCFSLLPFYSTWTIVQAMLTFFLFVQLLSFELSQIHCCYNPETWFWFASTEQGMFAMKTGHLVWVYWTFLRVASHGMEVGSLTFNDLKLD